MSHLNEESLARLADGEAGSAEGEHLASCDECRARLERYRGDQAALRALPRLEPPMSEWSGVQQRLRNTLRWRRTAAAFVGLAAASIVFVAGIAAGRQSLEPRSITPARPPASSREAAARLALYEVALLTAREAALSAPADPVVLAHAQRAMSARDSIFERIRLTSTKRWY